MQNGDGRHLENHIFQYFSYDLTYRHKSWYVKVEPISLPPTLCLKYVNLKLMRITNDQPQRRKSPSKINAKVSDI